MKRSIGIGAAVLLAVLFLFVYGAYHYYVNELPARPDNRNYSGLEERAQAAERFVKRHGMNEDYCLFVDYGIPSGTPRLFVWSFKENAVVARTYAMHGPGKGSTAEKPVFSNMPGSQCSSLGRFAVTKKHGEKLKRSFKLQGLDTDNQTAWARGLMIHRSSWVDKNIHKTYIPLHAKSCEGCVTVSSNGMDYLEKLINSQKKELLLWSFYTEG